MSEVAINIEGVCKRFRLGDWGSLPGLAKNALRRLRGDDRDLVWALRDITLTVERGAVVGLIGSNGAGKSTLLKILARIVRPTSGRVELFGRVGSLLEVGTGFHPELTGRENVYMSGAILGLRRQEINRQFDDIVGFAEVGSFLETPVKHYSSGMVVRLAFAVAAHLQPEVLLIDEVLAVGDAAFQRKCLSRMNTVAQGGRTVLFVSHQMQVIRNLCSRAVLLADGRVAADGPVEEVIDQYLDRDEISGEGNLRVTPEMHSTFRPALEIQRLEMVNTKGTTSAALRLGERFGLRIWYRVNDPNHRYRIGVHFLAADTTRMATLTSTEAIEDISGEASATYLLEIQITNVFLPGAYQIHLTVGSEVLGKVDTVTGFGFHVLPVAHDKDTVVKKRKGFVWLDADWQPPRPDSPAAAAE